MKFNRFTIVLLAPLLLPAQFSLSRVNEPPSPEHKISMYAKPAVVRVFTGCSGGYEYEGTRYVYNASKMGSGFLIGSDGYIVTNAHLADGKEECRQNLENNLVNQLTEPRRDSEPKERKVFTQEEIQVALESGEIHFLEDRFEYLNNVVLPNVDPISEPKFFPYEIKEQGSASNEGSKDVAVIKIAVQQAPILRFGPPEDTPQIQDPITVIGYPGLADPDVDYISGESVIEATVTDGIVSNPNKKLQDGSPIIQVDVLTAAGSSGSPVLNADGEVIGMIAFGGVELGAQIPFAIPTSTIQEFVRKSGALNQEGPTDHLYRDGLEFYWKGNYEGARTKFQAVTSLFPYHSEANRLLRDSEQQIAEAWDGKNFTLWLGSIGILVAVLAFIYWLVRRKPATLAAEGMAPDVAYQAGGDAEGPEVETRPTNLPRLITNFFPSKTIVSTEPLLELKNTQGQIRRIYLQEERYQLGRDQSWSTIEIPEGGWEVISRHHAILVKEGEDYRLYDGDGTQPSTNGTFIDGARIGPSGHLLHDGDRLAIGQDERNQVALTYLHPTSSRSASRPVQAKR